MYNFKALAKCTQTVEIGEAELAFMQIRIPAAVQVNHQNFCSVVLLLDELV